MRRKISTTLSILLVIGAMVLLMGVTPANAGSISNLYVGTWVIYGQSDHNDNDYTDYDYQLGRMTIGFDGVATSTYWEVIDLAKTEWTPSMVTTSDRTITYTVSAENASAGYISYSNTTTDAEGLTITQNGRCYGMLKTAIGYTEMQCINVITLKGGPFSLDEQNVTRMIAKRASTTQP